MFCLSNFTFYQSHLIRNRVFGLFRGIMKDSMNRSYEKFNHFLQNPAFLSSNTKGHIDRFTLISLFEAKCIYYIGFIMGSPQVVLLWNICVLYNFGYLGTNRRAGTTGRRRPGTTGRRRPGTLRDVGRAGPLVAKNDPGRPVVHTNIRP